MKSKDYCLHLCSVKIQFSLPNTMDGHRVWPHRLAAVIITWSLHISPLAFLQRLPLGMAMDGRWITLYAQLRSGWRQPPGSEPKHYISRVFASNPRPPSHSRQFRPNPNVCQAWCSSNLDNLASFLLATDRRIISPLLPFMTQVCPLPFCGDVELFILQVYFLKITT